MRSQVRSRPNLVLHPDECALLVVDMINYFAHPQGRAYLPASDIPTANISLLLATWRRRRAPVFFTRHCHEGSHDLGMLGRFFSDYIRAGHPESEIIPSLAPQTGETTIRKTTYDAFFDTNLTEALREAGAGQVLITGVLTHMCCETTARAAFVRGFEVYVPADACASSCERLHVGSLLSMADSVAVIMSTEEVLEQCAK